MVKTHVVIAHRSMAERDRLAVHVLAHYAGWADKVTVHDSPGKLFSRAAALNAGVQASTASVVICANSDVLIPHSVLTKAALLAAGMGVTVYPFTTYRELTKNCTERWLKGDRGCRDTALFMDDSVGPLFVVRRDAYLRAGGCDERFIGWGFEDVCWAITSETLLGPNLRVDGEAVHLWHHHDKHSRRGGGQGSSVFLRNVQLRDRYRAAAGKPAAIRKLQCE